MKTAIAGDITDLWEAWIALENDHYRLYVVGDVCTGRSKTTPVLLKKAVQGAAPSHLVLEVLPIYDANGIRLAEVGYNEPVADIYQYRKISIVAGEDVIACIPTIELTC